MVQKGTIQGFEGSLGSGLAILVIKKENGKIDRVSCDNAPTVRALESAYGNVIGAGHTASTKNIKGKEIFYDYTGWGSLAGFVPVEGAPPELLEEYRKQKKERSGKQLKKVV